MTADDAEFVLALLNEPAFHANIGDRSVRTLADAAAYIRSAPIFAAAGGLGFSIVVERVSGESVGMCGLVKRETLEDVDVGYAMLARFSGRGYAREAAAATVAHAREALGLARVVAITGPANVGSRRVLEAIGMRLERTLQLQGYAGESCLYATA